MRLVARLHWMSSGYWIALQGFTLCNIALGGGEFLSKFALSVPMFCIFTKAKTYGMIYCIQGNYHVGNELNLVSESTSIK